MLKQTAQQIAKQVAKQTLNESNEFLKSAREQIAPLPEKPGKPNQNAAQSDASKVNEEQLARQKSHMMQAYDNELNQIRRENLFKELQKKISEGEYVALEDFVNELSTEQKDVLKAQIEAVEARKRANENAQKNESLPQVVSKKGRQMFNKIKKRNEQHVETRMPPSS